MFGQQFYKISRLSNLVDVVITDSPLMLSILYNKCPKLGKSFSSMVHEVARSYYSLDYLLNPINEGNYDNVGRIHSQDESMQISQRIVDMLDEHSIRYKTLSHDISGYDSVVDDVLDAMRKNNENN